MCLWVLSEVVCARLLGSDKCLKHCMSKKLKLRSLSFSYQRLFPNSPFLPQVSYWLSVSKHLARVNIFFVFVLKVEEIWFGFLDLCTLLQPCIVTQDIRVSTYTLAIKVQNSEALKIAGSRQLVQHKLGHIQRLLTERFQHNPVSYPGRKIKFCREHSSAVTYFSW